MLKTSSTQSMDSLPLSMDMVGNVKISSNGNGNETVKRSPSHTKSIIGVMGYLILIIKAVFI